ncbi:hypothetical protein HII28_08580 [Planctomonas sp. JC2975]|uniref:hypothetical protein n=1 Tax=Planctomonas sp. JC2975 TaxID=2729626 RepID=UPI001472E149|nr:hypothetical protein [Planctomonas sp. JC2975]NNC11934.1 hypothetical protein [Planctomonas sp. JC2975]
MAFDFTDSLNNTTRNSHNTTNNTTDTTNLALGLNDDGNVASGNTSNTAVGSFNTDDSSDSSSHGSGNEWTSNLAWDTNNTSTVNVTDDHSVDVGDRTYNLGGGGSGSGDSTVVDQSVNADLHSFGPSMITSDGTSVIASGAGAIAAGDDVSIDEHMDGSTHILAGGNINIDDTTTLNSNWNSFNTTTDDSTHDDSSMHVDASDSFNSAEFNTTTDDSFNSEVHNVDTSHWDVDANVIWGSEGGGIIDAGS